MEKKETFLTVRLTADEKLKLKRKAHEHYQTMSDYLRVKILSA